MLIRRVQRPNVPLCPGSSAKVPLKPWQLRLTVEIHRKLENLRARGEGQSRKRRKAIRDEMGKIVFPFLLNWRKSRAYVDNFIHSWWKENQLN